MRESKDWEETPLLEYLDLVSSGVKPFIGKKKYVRTGFLETGKILDSTEVDYDTRPSRANMEVKVGDILFAKMKDTEKVFLITKTDEENLYSTGFAVLRVKNIFKLLPKFVFYWLRSNDFQRLKNKESTGATQKAISNSKLIKFKIPVPTIKYQELVIKYLERIESIIHLRKKANELSNGFLQSSFYKMFGNLDKNPKGWKVKTIKEMCEEIVDCPHSTPKYAQKKTIYPCIRTTELKDGYIEWSSMKYLNDKDYKIRVKRLIPKVGDIVYGREGTFGEAVIIPENINMSLGQRVMLFRAKNNLCTPEFLWSLIRSKSFYRKALSVTKGSTVGHVNVRDIIAFTGICPPLQLQKEYSRLVKKYNEILVTQKLCYQYLEDLFNSILQKAIKGKLEN